MPLFNVLVTGRGILLAPDGGSGEPVIGFVTTRTVRAKDETAAEVAARESARSEWAPNGDYYAANSGEMPAITVNEVWRIGLIEGLFGPKRYGYTFYTSEN